MCGGGLEDLLWQGANPGAALIEMVSGTGSSGDPLKPTTADHTESDAANEQAKKDTEKKQHLAIIAEEAKQKQHDLNRRNRKTTILTSMAENNAGQKTLLGQ